MMFENKMFFRFVKFKILKNFLWLTPKTSKSQPGFWTEGEISKTVKLVSSPQTTGTTSSEKILKGWRKSGFTEVSVTTGVSGSKVNTPVPLVDTEELLASPRRSNFLFSALVISTIDHFERLLFWIHWKSIILRRTIDIENFTLENLIGIWLLVYDFDFEKWPTFPVSDFWSNENIENQIFVIISVFCSISILLMLNSDGWKKDGQIQNKLIQVNIQKRSSHNFASFGL